MLLVLLGAWLAAGIDSFVFNLSGASVAETFELQICAGLVSPPVYLLGTRNDEDWAARLFPEALDSASSWQELAADCARQVPGEIQYDIEKDHANLPLLVTVCGVRRARAVPRGRGDMVYDMREIRGLSPAAATARVWHDLGNLTSGMAKWNPGYAVHQDPRHNLFHPPLVNNPPYHFVDFAVQRKLFTFFLPNGCIPFTEEHRVNREIVSTNHWDPPYPVYGYDDTWAIAGDLFEAQTNCIPEDGSLGQVPSAGASNLAYFSQMPDSSRVRHLPPESLEVWREDKVYVSFIYGDGDNLGMVLEETANSLVESLGPCLERDCSKIGWSLSPHLPYLAGAPFDWISARVSDIGGDVVLPPSGFLYSYPATMKDGIRKAYAVLTKKAADRLGTRVVSSWEWPQNWGRAIRSYFPLYPDDVCFFALNVPYFLPIFGLGYGMRPKPRVFNRYYAWYDDLSDVSPEVVASRVNDAEGGSVGYIYLGIGTKVGRVLDLIALLDDHVVTLSPNDLCTLGRP